MFYGATLVAIDECVENHGVVQADFTELCEAGVAIAKQAGPGNVVMRYLAQCPPAPKSKCSLKGLLREGADPDGTDRAARGEGSKSCYPLDPSRR